MSILKESGIRRLDIDLIKFFFTIKAAMLEHLEESVSGMYSTQEKLMELQGQLLDFLLAWKNRNSIFYIFLNKEKEENLKIVVSSVEDEPDELTKRYAIVINEELTEMKIYKTSFNSKLLNLIRNDDDE
jgi:hypothetical protein